MTENNLINRTLSSKPGQSGKYRFDFIDIARIIGVALVYYGHLVESYMKAGNEVAALQYKFIYSFHMPLFFILSGYIAKTFNAETTFSTYFRKHAVSRLLPYAFFAAFLIFPTLWTTDNTVGLNLPSVEGYMKGIAATFLGGFPYFNVPVWFLVCLFVVETIHYAVSRFLTSNARVILFALGFYLIGSILSWNAGSLNPINMLSPHGKIFPYFMVLEAFTGYSLYLVGIYMRRNNFLVAEASFFKCFSVVVLCFSLLYFTYDLNKAMFILPFYDAVILFASSHGNVILFPFTAIIGSIFVMALARIIPPAKILLYLGGNTLTIFALNGVFYHFVNDRLAKELLTQYTGNTIFIFTSTTLIAFFSLCLTIPFVFLFNRFMPLLVGKAQPAIQQTHPPPVMKFAGLMKVTLLLIPGIAFMTWYNLDMESKRLTPHFNILQAGKALVVTIKGEPDITMDTAGVTLYSAGRKIKLSPSYMSGRHLQWNQRQTVPRNDWVIDYSRPVPETAVDLSDIQKTAEIEIFYERRAKSEVAEIIHIGPYETIPESLKELRHFISDNGYNISGFYEEVYLVFEQIESDPKKYETLLRYQVQKL